MQNHPKKEFMEKAIEEAQNSASLGQYAIGAIVVGQNGEIISIGHTSTFETNDATAHAEVNAIRSACKTLNNRYLVGSIQPLSHVQCVHLLQFGQKWKE